MPWLSDIGHMIGKVASNPLVTAGISMIPGVGIPGAALAGGLGRLMAPGGNLGEAVKGGLTGAASGFAGGKLASMGGGGDGIMAKLGGIMQQGKDQLGESLAPGGKIDFNKILNLGGTAANMMGQRQQRASAQNYANSQIDQRNVLLGKINQPQNYGLPQITPAKDASAGIGY